MSRYDIFITNIITYYHYHQRSIYKPKRRNADALDGWDPAAGNGPDAGWGWQSHEMADSQSLGGVPIDSTGPQSLADQSFDSAASQSLAGAASRSFDGAASQSFDDAASQSLADAETQAQAAHGGWPSAAGGGWPREEPTPYGGYVPPPPPTF